MRRKMVIFCLCVLLFVPQVVSAEATGITFGFDAPAEFEDWLPERDTWRIEDGVLRQPDPTIHGTCAFLPKTYSDVSLTVRFYIHPAGSGVKAPGLIYRAVDQEHFYYIHYDSKNSQVVWVRWAADVGWTKETTHRHRPIQIAPEQWHTARVQATGATHKVFMDGELLFTQEDTAYPKGVVGLRCGQGDVSFDDLVIEGTPASLDREFEVEKPAWFDVCTDGGAGAYEAFPDVCRTDDGQLLVVFYAGYSHVSVPNDDLPKGGRICLVRSRDNGRTWSDPEIVRDSLIDDRDPSITQLSNGDLLVTYMSYVPGRTLSHAVYTIRSTDLGATWEKRKRVRFPFDGCQAVSEPVTELDDGTLLLPAYGRYTDPDYAGSPCIVLRSNDIGRTWPDMAIMHPTHGEHLYEPSIEPLPNGRIYMLIRPTMSWSVSEDGGVTWAPPKNLGIQGEAPYLLLTSKNVLLAGFRHRPTRTTSIARSTDFGDTWHGPKVIDRVIGGYPSFVELPDGRVFMVYYNEGAGSDIRGIYLNVTPEGVEPIRCTQ